MLHFKSRLHLSSRVSLPLISHALWSSNNSSTSIFVQILFLKLPHLLFHSALHLISDPQINFEIPAKGDYENYTNLSFAMVADSIAYMNSPLP